MNSHDVFPNIYAGLLLLLEEREETRKERILKERMVPRSKEDQKELVSSTSRHYCCD